MCDSLGKGGGRIHLRLDNLKKSPNSVSNSNTDSVLYRTVKKDALCYAVKKCDLRISDNRFN